MAYSHEWVFKKEFLEDVNSVRFSHSTNVKKEKENRFKTIWFIKDLSNALRPGPALDSHRDRKDEEADYDIRNLKVLWTACVFFHRFYVFHSFDSHSRFAVAVACLFLASKVEEKPLRLSDHIFMYFRLRNNKVLKKTEKEFKDMERDVLLAERILLQTLGFDLNVLHPFQFFRQLIGKDLKAWFADPEDSKQVLRLATNLLTDSFRCTLSLLYPPQQMACALVFLALQIMGLKPQAPHSSSAGGGNGGGIYGGGRAGHQPAASASVEACDLCWLELLERDVQESAVRDICFTLVDMYETSFIPADVPYAATATAHSELRSGIDAQLGKVAALRDSTDREGVEEFKGSGLGDWDKACASGGDRDGNGATNKRKLSIDATSAPSSVVPSAPACLSSAGVVSTGLGSVTKSRYTTLPPSFAESSTGSTGSTGSGVKMSAAEPAGGSSPCRVASTPRASGYRSGGADVDGDRGVGVGGQSPESCPLPPPESPGSAYSTFSQAQAHIQRSSAAAGAEDDGHDRLLAGEGVDSPFFMHPPAPDTPGSMASTPNFDNLPRAGESTSVSMGHHLPDHFSLQHAKRPRTDY